MRIYLSSLGSYVDDGCDAWLTEKGITAHLLGSFAHDSYYNKLALDGHIPSCKTLMIDSGAVSVRSGKVIVTFEGYMKYLQSLSNDAEIETSIIGFDVIGDPIASYKNYMRMIDEFEFTPKDFMPVFHYKQPMKYLEQLIDDGFTYIGLGGVHNKVSKKGLSQIDFRNWWSEVFFTVGENGHELRYPGIDFHGFAVTSAISLAMFPWKSVDSTAWIKNSAVGKILTPWGDVRISKHSDSGDCNLHFLKRDPLTQKNIVNWIESRGFLLQEVIDDRLAKNIINILYFLELQDKHEWQPKRIVQQTLFDIM